MPLLVADRARPHGGLVRVLTLSRPEKRNALNAEHLSLIQQVLTSAQADKSVRALLLTGDGGAFCAGYDLDEPFDPIDPDGLVAQTMAAVRNCSLPIIAWIDGPAYGAGLELAISTDVRVASTSASFCLPPARLGVAYAPAGLARLTALVGTGQARRLALAGAVLDAEQALQAGLVEQVDDRSAAEKLADTLADVAPQSVRHMKATLNALEPTLALVDAAAHEAHRRALFFSPDAEEGKRAFRERRRPIFTDGS